MRVGRLRFLSLAFTLVSSVGWAAEPSSLPTVFQKTVPNSIDDLKTIQQHVQKVTTKVLAATVGVRIGPSSGSGVIIDASGYVLTAGHVSGEPNRDCEIILPDGKKYKGKTLGANRGVDSGLIKIVDEGTFPFAEMGDVTEVKKGSWCLAIGHPNGYQRGRAPVVRLGRVLDQTHDFLRTDCALVGGDSGGPLFDMHGRVIGIHSRIGGAMTSNIHVPVSVYRENWDRLANAEVWGSGLYVSTSANAYLGVTMDTDKKGCKISVIAPQSPAERAGIQVDDQIVRVDGLLIQSADDLVHLIRGRRPGQEISLEVRRGATMLQIRVVLDKRPVS
jgi:serine protease Do